MVHRTLKLLSMGDNGEETGTILKDDNVDTKHGEKMLEEDQASWTVECLRGRLLAERVASKAAKQDAEFLGNRLIEVEEQLKMEIKLKKKAEKKLKFLIGELESIAMSPVADFLSPVDIEDCTSSSTASSSITTFRELNAISHSKRDMNQTTCSSLTTEDTRDSNSEINSTSSVSSSVGVVDESCEIVKDTRLMNNVAVVPTISQSWEPRGNNCSIPSAIGTLRHAKDQLGSSIRKGNLITPYRFASCAGVGS